MTLSRSLRRPLQCLPSIAGTAVLGAVLGSAPLAVLAHTGADAGAHHGFLDGLLHPLMGLDHLAAMVAVGLWSAALARRSGREGWAELAWAPAGFVLMLLAGALAGLQGLSLAGVEPMIAASLLVIGLLAATPLRLPGWAAAALVGVFALFHGLAHGTELAGDAAAPMLAGMLLATLALHLAGIGLGKLLQRVHAALPRLAGSCVAVLGLALLATR